MRTLSELDRAVAAGRYDLLAERRSSTLDWLQDGPSDARSLWWYMSRQTTGALVASVERGVALVGARPGLALFGSRETLQFEIVRFGMDPHLTTFLSN